MLLFNHPIWGIMPIINRISKNSDNIDDHYKAVVKRQIRNDKNYYAVRDYDLFSIGSTVVVQQEDDGLWIHSTIVGIGDHNHNNRSCTIRITRTGCIVTRNSKDIKTTPITAEQYFRDQLIWLTDDPVDRILKWYETLSMDKVQSNTNNKKR